MFDRHAVGEQAILVHVEFQQDGERESLEELEMSAANGWGRDVLSLALATLRILSILSVLAKLRKLLLWLKLKVLILLFLIMH